MPDRLVILDRDGVINQDSDAYIKSLDEWKPIQGSIDAIVRLSQAGYRVAIASNQSGLARGLFSLAALNAMHQRLWQLVATPGGRIEVIAFCPHGPDDGCRCRKPRTGLLEEIAYRLGADLADVPFIGDSISDIRAARAVGAAPWLVRSGKGERTLASIGDPRAGSELLGVPVYLDLDAAATALINNQGRL
ncbi:D-glycero-beta-D-manno-heptose 1,7-bisphosphate 7-phosphatase [Thiocystis violacea]|uniref:D-glycero-beta-D-manno-heptose 1,7-bisphosphate 7-phosphatase n=1 Tax=Thiocystis violacea TaxID=13725 RepID=UPI0019033680|nr:D-glycero-beta-D-manno-heptose 1,7-bisphosphate 7-phosphatase [Thiocystis violacea]MBK1717450.1 D-glycero-beta-D-manno-heptose-1,7-bisphosphate 7-phosphatase [Thiocystis violacea]